MADYGREFLYRMLRNGWTPNQIDAAQQLGCPPREIERAFDMGMGPLDLDPEDLRSGGLHTLANLVTAHPEAFAHDESFIPPIFPYRIENDLDVNYGKWTYSGGESVVYSEEPPPIFPTPVRMGQPITPPPEPRVESRPRGPTAWDRIMGDD